MLMLVVLLLNIQLRLKHGEVRIQSSVSSELPVAMQICVLTRPLWLPSKTPSTRVEGLPPVLALVRV